MPEESLKNKAIKGVGWSAIDSFSSYAIAFVTGIILARILPPEDYGLIGIITIFTAICQCFIGAGFGSALIRKNDASEDDYCTVFICNLCTSLFFYVLLFVCAPLIARFFERSELTALIRVSSLGIIAGALSFVQRTQLTKKIDFKTQTKVTIVSVFSQGVIGISLALSGFGVWALAIQGLFGAILSSALLWLYNRWIPKFRFSKRCFSELFGFSYKLLLTDIINTLWNQAYQVIIGKFYKPSTLGHYTRAYGYSSIVSQNLTYIVQRVSFPTLSKLQDDKTKLKNGYRHIIRVTMLVSFFCSLMMAAVAQPLIIVLIGHKWLEASYFLQIICFISVLYPLHAINLNVLQVLGRSDLFLKLEIYKKAILIIPIVLGIFIGIYWMLISSVITGIICYYINAYYSGKLLNYTFKDQVKDIMPSFLISASGAIMAYFIYLVIKFVLYSKTGFVENLTILLIILLVGSIISISLFKVTRNPEYIEIIEFIKKFPTILKQR